MTDYLYTRWRRFRRFWIRVFSIILSVLISPFRAVSWVANALASVFLYWWRSRQWRRLVWGLPALFVIASSLFFWVSVQVQSKPSLQKTYLQAGRTSARLANWKEATLYLERAIELGVRDQGALFELARAAEKSSNFGRRDAILARLAPLERAVHPDAHLWKAIELLSSGVVPPDDLRTAETHLRHCLVLEPANEIANGLLGDLYFQGKQYRPAEFHLGQASRQLAKYQLLHAKACVLIGKTAEAEASARLAERSAQEKLKRDPRDRYSRIELGEALFIQEDFESAINVLQDGLKRIDPNNKDQVAEKEELHRQLAMIYLGWSNNLLGKQRFSESARNRSFLLVSKAMQHDPNDSQVFNQLLRLLRENDSAAREAREFLLDNIATGNAVGLSHLILGSSYNDSNELEKAEFHLEQAFELLPQAPIVANNLAWHLLQRDPPQVDRAMRLIARVLERYPTTAAFVDTRAHAYLRQKKWSLALRDFQLSLTQFANVASVHRGMSEAYENLGMNELAERHGRIAAKLAEEENEQILSAPISLDPQSGS